MKTLSINSRPICKLPEKWSELSAKQLLQICSLTFSSPDNVSLTTQMLLLFAGLKFCQNRRPVMVDGIPHWYLKQNKIRIGLTSAEDLAFAASPLHFIFTEHKGRKVFESKLYKNLLPVISVGRKKLYGPDSALYNIRFAEFMRLEALYEQFMKTGDTEILDKLIAVLYRPRDNGNPESSPKFTGDVRIPFNDHLVDANKTIAKRMKPEYKLAVRLFYEGCRWFIFKGCKLFENAFGDAGSSDSNMPAMLEFTRLVNALSNDDASKMEQIRQTPAWDIFHQLEAVALRKKEIEAMNHKNKRHV